MITQAPQIQCGFCGVWILNHNPHALDLQRDVDIWTSDWGFFCSQEHAHEFDEWTKPKPRYDCAHCGVLILHPHAPDSQVFAVALYPPFEEFVFCAEPTPTNSTAMT